MPATELGATVVRAVLSRSKLDGSKVGTRRDGQRGPGRQQDEPRAAVSRYGGVPVDVPAMTVNRVCGSGAQAIASAAQEIMLGMLD